MTREAFNLDPKLLADIITPELVHEMCENGSRLEGEPLLRVWRRMEMQGDPPPYLTIVVSREDVERLAARLKRERKLKRRAERAKGGTA